MARQPIDLRDRLASARPLLGGFVFSSDPTVSSIYGMAGFDFVIIDMEHAANDIRSVQNHIRACGDAGIGALVRLGPATLADTTRLLDAGADGIMLPHLGLRQDETAAALAELRYQPEGNRPTCSGVYSNDFSLTSFAVTAARENRRIISVGLIEDGSAVYDIGNVLDSAGVDWVLPGPGDLATSLGVHGNLRHPSVLQAVETVATAARARSIPVGMYINDPSEMATEAARNCDFFILSLDYKILARTLGAACSEMKSIVSNWTQNSKRGGSYDKT